MISKSVFKTIGKIILGVGLSVLFIYWCFHQIDVKLFWKALEGVNQKWLVPAFLGSVAVLVLNSVQFKLFLPNRSQVPFRRMFPLISIFSMTVNVVPFWGGHALMIYLLGNKEKVGKSVALSAVTLDQIIEGFAKIFIFAVAAGVTILPPWFQNPIRGSLYLVGASYLILLTLSFIYRDAPKQETVPASGLKGRVYRTFVKWAHHLHVLRSFPAMILTVSLAILMKLVEVSAIFFVQKSLNLGLGWDAAFLVTAAISLATTLPLTPGRVGLIEGAALLTYSFLGIPKDQALAAGILIHAAHTVPFILFGYFYSLRLGWRGRSWWPSFEKESAVFAKTGA